MSPVTLIRCFRALAIGALASSLALMGQDRKPTDQEQETIRLAAEAGISVVMNTGYSQPEIANALRQALMAPYAVNPRLPADVYMRTRADVEENGGDHVWRPGLWNTVVIRSGMIKDGQWRTGMSTPWLRQLVGGGMLYAEMAHQELRSRTDPEGGFKPDPPNTPDARTKEQNRAAWRASEREAGERLVYYMTWLLSLAAPPTPFLELTDKDREQIERLKKAGEQMIKENT